MKLSQSTRLNCNKAYICFLVGILSVIYKFQIFNGKIYIFEAALGNLISRHVDCIFE